MCDMDLCVPSFVAWIQRYKYENTILLNKDSIYYSSFFMYQRYNGINREYIRNNG